MAFEVKDYYFHKAKKDNYLARSVYKLEEINDRYKVIKKNDQVVDFGYYPGSWAQYTSKIVGPKGLVVGLDLQPVNDMLSSLKNVSLFQKNAEEVENLTEIGVDKAFDVVLSDMAPKTTGIAMVDQQLSYRLVEKVFSLLPLFLRPKGHVVVKVFESHDVQIFLKDQKKFFKDFNYLRPKSTRSTSKEFFVIAKGFLA